ncbi:hypothetical protein [Sporomusa sphaeroides]|nr:hypothetical protein [Sporomusa sphaeroides]HML32898.1 hypothetical protein [Sporomusa sphaeroides]
MMRYYTLSVIEEAYRRQNPELTEAEIKEKAKKIHSQLNTLDISWRRSNKKFYRMNEFGHMTF